MHIGGSREGIKGREEDSVVVGLAVVARCLGVADSPPGIWEDDAVAGLGSWWWRLSASVSPTHGLVSRRSGGRRSGRTGGGGSVNRRTP
jgi:hypothetical protein